MMWIFTGSLCGSILVLALGCAWVHDSFSVLLSLRFLNRCTMVLADDDGVWWSGNGAMHSSQEYPRGLGFAVS